MRSGDWSWREIGSLMIPNSFPVLWDPSANKFLNLLHCVKICIYLICLHAEHMHVCTHMNTHTHCDFFLQHKEISVRQRKTTNFEQKKMMKYVMCLLPCKEEKSIFRLWISINRRQKWGICKNRRSSRKAVGVHESPFVHLPISISFLIHTLEQEISLHRRRVGINRRGMGGCNICLLSTPTYI